MAEKTTVGPTAWLPITTGAPPPGVAFAEEFARSHVAQLQRENTSSIELKRNAKGEYAWDLKVYFSSDISDIGIASEEETRALSRLHRINQALEDEYIVTKE